MIRNMGEQWANGCTNFFGSKSFWKKVQGYKKSCVVVPIVQVERDFLCRRFWVMLAKRTSDCRPDIF